MCLGVLDDTKWNANRRLRKTGAGQPGSAPECRREALRQRDTFGSNVCRSGSGHERPKARDCY
jgi:hypothetical protein